MIRLEQIDKYYDGQGGARTVALSDVNLRIEGGSIYGIIGRSGAGKSTLIRLLNLLERPSRGRIYLKDEDLTTYKGAQLRQLRHRIGMVFQHFNLLSSRTVLDNVALPLRLVGMPKPAREQKARDLLALVGLSEHEHKYPAQLSGGQKQRVGIARALANNPELLLCDEATSALDPETTQSILSLLLDINERLGITIVMITHSMDVIRRVCDRVAVLDQGRLVEEGEVIEVFLHPQHLTTQSLLLESSGVDAEAWRQLLPATPEAVATLAVTSATSKSVAGDVAPATTTQGAESEGRTDVSGTTPTAPTVLRLSYRGAITAQPLISRMSQALDLEVSILQGTVGQLKGNAYGQLVVALYGAEVPMAEVERFLAQHQIQYEVLV